MKTERLYIRVSPEQKRFLEQAAYLEERSLSEFVLIASLRRAEDIFRKSSLLLPSGGGQPVKEEQNEIQHRKGN